jgi:hypothetical protein
VSETKDPCVHIFAQAQWHDDAFIIGNREGLMRIRDAIDRALGENVRDAAAVSVSDGEGYTCFVAVEEGMDDVRVPYTDPIGSDMAEGRNGYDVIGHSRVADIANAAWNKEPEPNAH